MPINNNIQKIKELLGDNLPPCQITHSENPDGVAFYVTIGETFTFVSFPQRTINNLDQEKMPDYFKEIKLYDSIVDTKIRITIGDNIAIWPNHPPL